MQENTVGRPLSTKRRKRLLDSKVIDISYDDLHKMYMTDCILRNISEITIKGYDFAYTYFKKYAGEDLMASDITQDLINGYVLYLKGWLKAETVNSYQFKVSPVIKYGMSKGYIKDTIEFTRLAEQRTYQGYIHQ